MLKTGDRSVAAALLRKVYHATVWATDVGRSYSRNSYRMPVQYDVDRGAARVSVNQDKLAHPTDSAPHNLAVKKKQTWFPNHR